MFNRRAAFPAPVMHWRNRLQQGAAVVASVMLVACSPDGPRDRSGDSSAPYASELGLVAAPVGYIGDSARGLALVSAFRDSLPMASGNGLRCTSCHLDNGTRVTAMPWIGSAPRYPRFRSRSGTEETMPVRVNDCITRSLAGRALHPSSREMLDIVAYLDALGHSPRPAGVDTVRLRPDSAAGRIAYSTSCARCHGENGNGTDLAPAVWGADAYSIGAGMARQTMLATFLRHNMPFDAPGTLSEQDAADIAAYVNAQARQDYPGKELDWPGGNPPADVAYRTSGALRAGKSMPREPVLLPRRVAPDAPPR